VEAGIERRAEVVEEGDGTELGVGGGGRPALQEERTDRPQKDAQYVSGERPVRGGLEA